MIDQDYAFNIYRALRSGKSDDVNFDSWKSDVNSLLDAMQKLSMTNVTRKSFDDKN